MDIASQIALELIRTALEVAVDHIAWVLHYYENLCD